MEKHDIKLKSKGFFLTYPKCPVPRQVCADMLATKGTIIKGVVCQEQHKDGDLHLHAYVKYLKEIQTRNMKYFDIEHEGEIYHGNYQTAKSSIAIVRYCTKDDQEPLELGDMDWKQETAAKQSKQKILGKRLASGETVADVLADGNEELIISY